MPSAQILIIVQSCPYYILREPILDLVYQFVHFCISRQKRISTINFFDSIQKAATDWVIVSIYSVAAALQYTIPIFQKSNLETGS